MNKILILVFFAVPMLLQAKESSASNQDQKLPVPGSVDLKKAEADIREIFKEDFTKKDRDGKRSLSQKLLLQAADTKNTSTARYAALCMSRDLAMESLDLETAFSAIEQLEKFYDVGKPPLTGATFTVNSNALKVYALNAARKFATVQADMVTLSEGYFKVACDSMREKSYDDVAQAAQVAEQYAKSAKLSAVAGRAAQLIKEASELKKEDEQFGKAISSHSDDPGAKLVKGRYLLFVVGDEKAGIENLLGCSDEGLKNIAKIESTQPTAAEQKMEIAEAWLALSKKEENVLHKHRYQLRARHWFDESLKDAGSLMRAKIEKRKTELDKALSTSAGIKSSEPSSTGLVGRWLLEEGTGEKISDSSGKGNHGKFVGGVKWVPGSKALNFDGKSGSVSLGSSGLPQANAEQTITWAHQVTAPPTLPNTSIISLTGESLNITAGYQGTKLALWKWAGTTLVSADAGTVGEWHSYAYVFDGKTHKLYVDGILKDSSTVPSQMGTYKSLDFGRWKAAADPQFFNGMLGEVRIYSRALAESEIKAFVSKQP